MTDEEVPARPEIDRALVDVTLTSPHGEVLGLLVEAALVASSMADADADAETSRLALREGPAELDGTVSGDLDATSEPAPPSPSEPDVPPKALAEVALEVVDPNLVLRAIPGTGRRVLGHLATALGLAVAAIVTAAAGANGSLYRMDGWGVAVLLAAFVALVTQALCALPTMRSPRPPTRLLLVSSALPFALAAFASAVVFPKVLRDFSVSGLRSYPTFLIIAATVGAAAFLASALALRASVHGLLALVPTSTTTAAVDRGAGGAAHAEGDPAHALERERAETRALFAVSTNVAAAIVVVAGLLVLGLPLSPTLAFFVLGTILLGLVARTHALGAFAVHHQSPSALRDRLAARVGPLPVFALGAGLLLGLSLAMGIRYQMLSFLTVADAETAALAAWHPTAHAAIVDRALLIVPLLLGALATAGFWLPPRLLPTPAAEPTSPRPSPERRLWIVAIVAAMLGAGLLLRMEDVYERRVAPQRERYLVAIDKVQPT
jgi:hypothetical protein